MEGQAIASGLLDAGRNVWMRSLHGPRHHHTQDEVGSMRSAIYPRRAAAILGQDRSGEKYKPRTDTDQDSFFAAWCRQCQRDKAMRDGCDIDECDDNERCDIIASTQRYDVDDAAYPQQWQIGKDGQPCCTTFVLSGDAIPPPRDEMTIDMFDHTHHEDEVFK